MVALPEVPRQPVHHSTAIYSAMRDTIPCRPAVPQDSPRCTRAALHVLHLGCDSDQLGSAARWLSHGCSAHHVTASLPHSTCTGPSRSARALAAVLQGCDPLDAYWRKPTHHASNNSVYSCHRAPNWSSSRGCAYRATMLTIIAIQSWGWEVRLGAQRGLLSLHLGRVRVIGNP